MNKKTIKLTEDDCITAIQDFITTCDADELARLTGELYGGDCHYIPAPSDDYDYSFIPNEFYSEYFEKRKVNETNTTE